MSVHALALVLLGLSRRLGREEGGVGAEGIENLLLSGSCLAQLSVSRCGLVVRRLAGKQKDLGSIRFGSPFSSLQKLSFMDTVL